MGKVTINGMTFTGNNITVNNGNVIIDGKQVEGIESKTINISVTGNIEALKVDSCKSVSVEGNVNNLNTTSGDVEVEGSVNGNVSTVSGDVECSNIGGSVSTVSGDVSRRFR